MLKIFGRFSNICDEILQIFGNFEGFRWFFEDSSTNVADLGKKWSEVYLLNEVDEIAARIIELFVETLDQYIPRWYKTKKSGQKGIKLSKFLLEILT